MFVFYFFLLFSFYILVLNFLWIQVRKELVNKDKVIRKKYILKLKRIKGVAGTREGGKELQAGEQVLYRERNADVSAD